MMKSIKSLFMAGAMICSIHSYCQDTTALIKEYNQVLSFSVKPYVFYTMQTKMRSMPVLDIQDTATVTGEFYKRDNDLYYRSGADEVFLRDSFYIEINSDRKSIVVSKV